MTLKNAAHVIDKHEVPILSLAYTDGAPLIAI